MRWPQEQRLRFIDSTLKEIGTINREDITKKFGISIPQVSHDFRRYRELAPKNINYDTKLKVYCRGDEFYPVYSTPSEEDIGARARHNKKNPVHSFRERSVDPDGTLMPKLLEKFGNPVDWAAVVRAALD